MTLPTEAWPSTGVIAALPGSDLRSGIYEGTVVHHRYEPVEHHFSYRITMTMVDLDEIDAVCDRHPLWSSERANAVSFRRADYLGRSRRSLTEAVRDLVRDPDRASDRRVRSPYSPSSGTWGWLFNPISVYYCYAPDGMTVETVVVEVTNTPWHERTAYVLPGDRVPIWWPSSCTCHPSCPWTSSTGSSSASPGHAWCSAWTTSAPRSGSFSASMVLDRRPADRRSLGRVLWRYPLMTMRRVVGHLPPGPRPPADGACRSIPSRSGGSGADR